MKLYVFNVSLHLKADCWKIYPQIHPSFFTACLATGDLCIFPAYKLLSAPFFLSSGVRSLEAMHWQHCWGAETPCPSPGQQPVQAWPFGGPAQSRELEPESPEQLTFVMPKNDRKTSEQRCEEREISWHIPISRQGKQTCAQITLQSKQIETASSAHAEHLTYTCLRTFSKTQPLNSITFSPIRWAKLTVISKEEFWILCILNVCFSLFFLLSVDCIYCSWINDLTAHITLFWSYLAYWCLQFQVKFSLTFPLTYLWWAVTLMYELWRSQESLSSWWEASSAQILAMEYVLA